MTKAEIIDAIYEKVGGFSKKEAAELVEAVFDTMKENLAEGDKIKISGFGNFVVREKKERTGRNPQTGAPIPISARRVLTFKPSQVLKKRAQPAQGAAQARGARGRRRDRFVRRRELSRASAKPGQSAVRSAPRPRENSLLPPRRRLRSASPDRLSGRSRPGRSAVW